MRPQQGVEIEIAGIIDQHRVARFDQQPAEQVDRLDAGFGQDDVFRRGLDAAIGHAPGDQLTQRRQAERRSIGEQHRGLGAGECSQ
jgi:hypothetical protein